jgi:alpha-tubulin suppressor-like RCC1 family protein
MGTGVLAADPYYYATCATTTDGSAYCWGYNGNGDLGNGLMSGMANVPSQVLTAAATPIANVSKVLDWLGEDKMCALKTDGTVWCWGGSAALYAAPLSDSTTQQVTGVTIAGRECYLDANDAVWVNTSKSGNTPTCP